jgi:hypothetical protein
MAEDHNVFGVKHQKLVSKMETFMTLVLTATEFSLGNVPPPAKALNTGDSDASLDSTPSQFLLLRGLEPGVTEEMLSRGVAKLYKPPENQDDATKKTASKISSTTSSSHFGAQDGSIRRVFIVRDRNSEDSWRFGFAEFHSVEDAQAALARFDALDKFTIASKPVLASYIHAGVFVPSTQSGLHSFAASSNPLVKLSYWDQKAYARELMIADEPPEGYKSAADALTTNAENGNKEEAKPKKRKAETAVAGSNKKTMPSHLQFWKDRQSELRHGKKNVSEDKTGSREALTVSSYADMNKKCCYLCFRQFKTEAEVNKHERLSQLHRENLNKDAAVAKAEHKLKKAGIEPRIIQLPVEETQTGPNDGIDSADYRDRAKERRKAYGQPIKPKFSIKPWNSAPAVEEEVKTTGSSKGASLLSKMGWKEGQGLGAQGTGMVAPIATDAYAQGVGLGAAGGKLGDAAEEAERRTKGGYAAFVDRAKEGARERYESMKDDTT